MNKIDRDMEHYAQITSRHIGEDFSKFRVREQLED